MKITHSNIQLLGALMVFAGCQHPPGSITSRFPAELDTLKYKQGTANPSQITTLRLMVGERLKPNGYFYGAPGVAPDGEVSREIIKNSPAYSDTGVTVYYKYLESEEVVRTDTFRFYFGPKE